MPSDASNRPPDVRVRVPDRTQVSFCCLDDLLPPHHPARLVWDVVGRLDLSAFYAPLKARQGVVGRDANDPRMMVALWLFACTQGVGSARELDRLCREHHAYRWLCGGVSVNYHTLADFRVGFGEALDGLFTRVVASLVDKELITVERVSQDGTRVRACAGSNTFRRRGRLTRLLEEARRHVAEVRAMLDDPEASAGMSARRKAAAGRAAREREQRLEAALARVATLERKQAETPAKRKPKEPGREPRASTGDAEARVMKMPDGGFRPAVNVQLAVDTASRAVVGVDVVNEGVDTGQLAPMREQVRRRTGLPVKEHLADGGFLTLHDVEKASGEGVTLYVPPKPPRNTKLRGSGRGSEYEPRPDDSEAARAWRARMGSEEGKAVYEQRASTVETVNAELKRNGLVQLTVRGLKKAKCVALWCALAYNVAHFAGALLG